MNIWLEQGSHRELDSASLIVIQLGQWEGPELPGSLTQDLGAEACGWLGAWLELLTWVLPVAWVSLQHGDYLWGDDYKKGPGRGLKSPNQP